MRRVLIFGTFDILHPGHIFFIKFSAKYGALIVSLARDSHVKLLKNKQVNFNFRQRHNRLGRLKVISDIVPSDPILNSYKILSKVRPNLIILGHDQRALLLDLKRVIIKRGLDCKIMTAPKFKRDTYASVKFTTYD
jgi:FAD synthetase